MAKLSEKEKEKPAPRELDLDITGLRAAKLADLRAILRDLEDLDVVERLLNRQMHHVATEASVTIRESGRNGHGRLLLPATATLPEESEEEKPPRKRRRRGGPRGPDVAIVQNQVLAVLTRASKRGPLQAGAIREAMRERFAPPHTTISTMNRALLLLREAKRISKIDPGSGQRYPRYAIFQEEEAPSTEEAPPRKPRRKPSPGKQSGVPAKANGVSTNVLRVLADGDPKGMEISDITPILEKGGVEFLPGYTHNTQVSWALKGHRNHHRLETIEKKDGTRIHRLLLPKINVTKG